MTDSPSLSKEQLHSLHDILSHHELYQEISDFRAPGTLAGYGPPFAKASAPGHTPKTPSQSPALQALLSRLVLTLPGVQNLSDAYWQTLVTNIIEDLEKAELSESYDKGIIGVRRTLSTAVSSLAEYPLRGIATGIEAPETSETKGGDIDLTNAEELQRAFYQYMQEAVYGNALEESFKKTAETNDLSQHSQLLQALHEYIIVNVASFMHYTLILSPKGQSLLVLIDQAHRMIPYAIMRQTLKIGNVATMIQGMVRVILAKVSLGSVTNFIGLSKGADEGMNLLQQIISGVLGWENRDLKSRASKIEKAKGGPSKDQLSAVKAYLTKSREEHEAIRSYSQQSSVSIAHAILSSANADTSLSEQQHEQLAEYLALQLAIRDREQLVKVLCHSNPDNLTQAVREAVAAYDSIIRQMHNAVDLSETVSDFERFVNDTMKLAKLPADEKDRKQPLPTVGDFVQLIRKHVTSTHKFLHQCAKNGPELTKWFYDWGTGFAKEFKRKSSEAGGAGDVSQPLLEIFNTLSEADQQKIIPILDQHRKHLDALHASSTARLRAVLASPPTLHPALASKNPSRVASRAQSPSGGRSEKGVDPNDPGPGAYLARWQDLLDQSAITPAQAEGGKVRSGGSGSVLIESKKMDVDPDAADKAAEGDPEAADSASSKTEANLKQEKEAFQSAHEKLQSFGVKNPGEKSDSDVNFVVERLGSKYRELLGKKFSEVGVKG